MTDHVAGGLGEPEALQPEQGALRLASDEDDWSRADWERAAAGVLRKARRLTAEDPDEAVWDALVRTTYDGVAIPPLGTRDLLDGLATAGRPTRTGNWDVRVALHEQDETALPDLQNGATSLWLVSGDLEAQLDGVRLDLAPVVLDNGTPRRARVLLDLGRERGTHLHPDSNLGADPIGARLRAGADADDASLVEMARLALDREVRAVVVDATVVHDLGGSDAQEVGYSLAVAAAYLRRLAEAGIGVDEAAPLLEFRYAATDEQFPTIAKLRAARRCWGRVLELSGTSGSQRQHAVTSRPMMSACDPWVNMLRGTVAAFAAGVSGAEAVTVIPFDAPLGEPDAFGRRIARNVSSLLLAESHLGAVTDPAGGAYAVEKLTDDLAAAAWGELQRLEAAGGVVAALQAGSFLAAVAEVAARRERDVATRARPITGLSEFPNLGEVLPERRPDGGSAFGSGVRRWGAAFEQMRSDPPAAHVFLATLGSVAQHTARAGFAANLLASGGIAVDVAGATTGADDLVAAYDGQAVVCLAGSDAAYAEWGEQGVAALRTAGATHVIVAGAARGATGDPPWADDSFHPGDDAVTFLTRVREALR